MCSSGGNAVLPALGLPIRRSAVHRLFSASPRLIAAVHVLHRLLVPRHPPCALTILTVIWPRPKTRPGDTRYWLYCAVLKVREEASACRADRCSTHSLARGASSLGPPAYRRSLKTRQHAELAGPRYADHALPGSVDVLGPAALGTQPLARRARATGAPFRCIPRKEVIQPQLPLRLPCYDFTPVTGPTFDGSLPCGLGHRLRALPIPVV
jgi:hypothetical protein